MVYSTKRASRSIYFSFCCISPSRGDKCSIVVYSTNLGAFRFFFKNALQVAYILIFVVSRHLAETNAPSWYTQQNALQVAYILIFVVSRHLAETNAPSWHIQQDALQVAYILIFDVSRHLARRQMLRRGNSTERASSSIYLNFRFIPPPRGDKCSVLRIFLSFRK